MQLKFLTLGFISAAVFSNVAFAHDGPSLVNLEDTHVDIKDVVTDVLNNLNAKNLLKNLNLDAASHILSKGGDAHLDRRRLHDALRRREWERDENENEPDEEEEDEEEEDEDEEDEDENEPDEEEEDEEEEDEDEADESSVAKVARRSTEEDMNEEDMNEEDMNEEDMNEEDMNEEDMNEEDVDEEDVDEEDVDEEDMDEEDMNEEDMNEEDMDEEEMSQNEMSQDEEEEDMVKMARRDVPGIDGLLGGDKSKSGSGKTDDASSGLGGLTSIVGKATKLASVGGI